MTTTWPSSILYGHYLHIPPLFLTTHLCANNRMYTDRQLTNIFSNNEPLGGHPILSLITKF